MEDEQINTPDLLVEALQQCRGDLTTLFEEFNIFGALVVAQKYGLLVNGSCAEFSKQFMEFWNNNYGPFF